MYGMDAASGAAVAALEISCGVHVLDLCATPGARLCMMAEFLRASWSLTAVDIARPRLAACRTMLQTYGLGRRTRLYLGDGTFFSLLLLTGMSKLCPTNFGEEWRSGRTRQEKRAAKRAKYLGIPLQIGEEGYRSFSSMVLILGLWA